MPLRPAQELTDEVRRCLTAHYQHELEAIAQSIETAHAGGKTTIIVKKLLPAVLAKLEQEGYKIRVLEQQRDPDEYEVSWAP